MHYQEQSEAFLPQIVSHRRILPAWQTVDAPLRLDRQSMILTGVAYQKRRMGKQRQSHCAAF